MIAEDEWGKLYRIDYPNDSQAAHQVVRMTCPSTGRIYAKPVPLAYDPVTYEESFENAIRINSPRVALGWTVGNGFNPQDYGRYLLMET